MKNLRLYLALAAMLLPLCGWAQAKLFDKYSDMKDVKFVYISKAMLDMGPHYFTDFYIGSAAKRLNAVHVLSTTNANVYKEMLKDIRNLLKQSRYELLLKQKGATSNAEFYTAKSNGRIKELAILSINEGKSLRFMHLEGNMSESDVKNILLYEGVGSIDTPQTVPYWKDLLGWEGLADLGSLESLKDLGNLKCLDSLEELEKYMDGDAWKEFNKQMENLRESLKDLDVERLN